MLSFTSEFPLSSNCSPEDFIEIFKDWVVQSPHTRFAPPDLVAFAGAGEQAIEKEGERIRSLRVATTDEESVAIQRSNSADHVEWVATAVFSRQRAASWVGVRIERESTRPAAVLPAAKKPVLVRKLLDRYGGAADGLLPIVETPVLLGNDDIRLATRLITGKSGCYLPVIYVSHGFGGGQIVDANALAYDLSGMAHVVVEPNRPFSRRLQIDVDSENVYGGTVGIYWPDGGGRRSFFLGKQYGNPDEIRTAIDEEVRTALMNRRPLLRCTWAAVQEALARRQLFELQQSGSNDIEKFVSVFDGEIAAKAEQLAGAEREIDRLRAEIRKYESQSNSGAELAIRSGMEQDLYLGEVAEILRDAIADTASRVLPDSRRGHVLKALVAANPSTEIAKTKREELKSLLREYRGMDRKIKKGLEDLGFSITEEGKHYKVMFSDDDRYTFSLPKSGSDYRGGLNAASDIAKRLF